MEIMDYNAQMCNNYFNLQPSEVKGRLNNKTAYHKRYLYQKLFSVFKFDLPNEWKLNYFRYWLFNFGSVAVIYTKEYGWICSPYSITKLDWQYNPKEILVVNPRLKLQKTGIVGVNCVIVHLFDDYFGIDDLITDYAEKLAQCDKDINVNLMNANVSVIQKVKSKKEADAVKEAYAQATEGKPFVTVNKDLLTEESQTLLSNIRNTYIANDILDTKRTIINEFLTTIGIPNSNTDKKERLITDEVNSNNAETSATVEVMLEHITEAFERLNSLGCDIGVTLRYNVSEGVEDNEQNNA